MSESPGSKKGGNPEDQINSSGPIPAAPQSASPESSASKPEMIKEKFLAVAKEKNRLESVIMQQSDMIKNLEKDKSELTLSLKILSESQRKMKEKLLDFDILRNMEVSEFKKKIENLITENKRLLSEKNLIFTNLDRDQKNISVLDSQISHSLLKEKEELETRLNSAIEELKQLRAQVSTEQEPSPDNELPSVQSTPDRVPDDAPEAALLVSQLREIALDRDEVKAELNHARAEIDRLGADKTRAEEELQQKIAEYSEEIADLRIDIDELTSAIESKLHYIDEVQAKVTTLSEELMHKDNELHEQIPALLENINSLSLSIDNKMEENSGFAKELFDLNVKISALNDELIRKDELFIEITEDYQKQKEELSSLHEVHGQPLQDLREENDRLRYEINDLRSAASETEKMIETNRNEKDLLERKAADSDARIDELAKENAALAAAVAEKDKAAADLLQELAISRNIEQQAAAETGGQLAALREQVLTLLEKNEMLTILSSERHAEADARVDELVRENAALAVAMAEKDKAAADLLQELARSRDLARQTTDETASQIAALREQVLILNQQLLEKNEMLTSMSSERHAEADARADELARESAALASIVAEKEKTVADLQEELVRYKGHVREATEKTGAQVSVLKEQVFILNQQLLEKNEMITSMSSERHAAADARVDELVRENAALAAAMAEKDKAAADLLQEFARSRDLAQQTADETASHIAALREQVLILNQQLLEKNEMITVLSSERIEEKEDITALQAGYQEEISLLKDETNRLKEDIRTREKQIEEYQSQVDKVLQDKTQIEAQFTNALEKLQELADEQARLSSLVTEKEHSLEQAQREGNALRTSTESLAQKIFELEKTASENEPASAHVDAEKDQLLRSAREYQESFEHLKEEIISLSRTIAEKEQQINQLNSDKIALISKTAEQQATLERLQLDKNQELIDALSKQKIDMEILQRNKDLQVVELKRDLSSYAEALADLRSKLEQSIRENDSLKSGLRAAPETSERFSQKKPETLPVRLRVAKDISPNVGKHSLTYLLLAILLITIIGSAFYAYNTGLLALPDRPTVVQQAEPVKELSYQEMFALLNQSVTDGLKFQATLITESLVLKSKEPADRSLFDFQHYLYFKVNVSSPQNGLDTQIANDPYSRILLSAGTADVKPMPGKKAKEIKTFYRKESPVSIIFYCVFPKETLAPDSTSLKLSLKQDTAPATLVWDLRQLRKHNLVP